MTSGPGLNAVDEEPGLHRKSVELADGEQAHVLAVEVLCLFIEKPVEQAHQGGDFGRRTAPVFRGKCVERQVFHTQLDTRFHYLANGFRPGTVTLESWKPAFLGPAAIPIHDDGDVAWDFRMFHHGGRLSSG